MQLALRADSTDIAYDSDRSSAPSRRTKMMVAGIAAASASVIAINPVSPALPELQHRAVELAAVANPLVVLQEALANTFNNLGTLANGTAGATNATATALSNPAVYAQIANFIAANAANPGALLSQLAAFQTNFGTQIGTQTALSQAAFQTALNNLPTVLQNSFNFLTSGQFVEAFSELNIYLLVQLIERPGNPLVPLFQIPGDIAAALPGGQIVANVLDALLTRGGFSGLTRALLVAPITATLQVAEIFDAVRAAVVVGDFPTAVNELINLPVRVVNAFVNGYVPNFPTRSLFQGLLSPNGPLDYFLVDLPNIIFGALNASVAPPVVTTPAVTAATLASVASTDLGLGTTVSLTEATEAAKTAPATEAAAGTETAVEGTPAAETAPVETAPVVEETAPVETAPVVEETAPAAETPVEVETPAATPVSTNTATETEPEAEATPAKTPAASGSNKPVSSYGSDKTGSAASGTATSGSATSGTAASAGSTGSGSTASTGTASDSGTSVTGASSTSGTSGSDSTGSAGGSDSGSSDSGE